MPVTNVAVATRALEQPPLRLFLGSLSLTLANPKTIAFFLALLPTVVHLESLTLPGFCAVVLAICVVLPFTLGCYVLLAARTRTLFQSPRSLRALNRGAGIAIAGAAVTIATR
jgi:threonine/homoserine/homoserine lactone efflux protein